MGKGQEKRRENEMDAKLQRQLEDSWYLRRPMREETEDSAEYRWFRKPVTASRKIPLARNFACLRMTGHGRLGVDRKMSRSGEGSVYLDFAVQDPVQNPSGRAYSEAELKIPFAGEDLSEYNRISIWIYVDAPGSSCSFMTLALHNAGPKVMPVPGRFEGSHSIMGPGGKWFRTVWEIPNVARNNVTAITVTAQAYGTSVPCAERVRIYFDCLSLEKVKEDHWKGFRLPEENIAYCHSGYRLDGMKQALICSPSERFELIDSSKKMVYEGRTKEGKKGFWLLDFSDFKQEGWFRIHVGQIQSEWFPIGREAYLSAAWKSALRSISFLRGGWGFSTSPKSSFTASGASLVFVPCSWAWDACTSFMSSSRFASGALGWLDISCSGISATSSEKSISMACSSGGGYMYLRPDTKPVTVIPMCTTTVNTIPIRSGIFAFKSVLF